MQMHTEAKETCPHSGTGKSTVIEQGLSRIAAKAREKPEEKFSSLAHHINQVLIEQCIRKIPAKSAAGIDGLNRDETINNLDWLLNNRITQIHNKCYDASAVRRVYIPKDNGGQRPLGIPPIIERGIQAATSKVLEQIYEQDFLNCSFGFRPNRSCHQALMTMQHFIQQGKMNYALEVDIRDFFGSLDHGWLLKFLGHRISDQRILSLIDSWLKAGIMEEGKFLPTEIGSPQGGGISPLLANIYLHYVLDLWFERKIQKQIKGATKLIRYCDDFLVLFEDPQDIGMVRNLLEIRLKEFGLKIAEEKTHETDLTLRQRTEKTSRRHISFLGMEIFRAKTKSGKGTKVVFKTQGRRFGKAKQKLKEKLKKIMHWRVEDQAKTLNSILRGHWNYYGLPGNSQSLNNFYYEAKRLWRRALGRRSQRGKMSWEAFSGKVLAVCPLTNPHLKITYGTMHKYVKL